MVEDERMKILIYQVDEKNGGSTMDLFIIII
jgi:hypothetical protein